MWVICYHDLCTRWCCRDWTVLPSGILAGFPATTLAPLQLILHAAAQLVLNLRRRDHVTPALREQQCTGCRYRAGSSLSCVYWFTRYCSAVFMVPQRPIDPILLLTYPEDPQSGHQASATSLCHVYKSSPGTELYLFLPPYL